MIQHLWRKIGTAGMLILMLGLAAGNIAPHALAAPAPQTGPTTWTVLVGGQAGVEQQAMGPAGAWQFMRFYPDRITINAGDTIVWKLASAEPHTVTFPAPGEQPPALIIPEGEDSQRMLFNPLAALPQGGSDYDGTAFTGSGQMGMEPQFPKEYSLTFTTPGSYEYICVLHDPMGMVGQVTVQAQGAPAELPTTGGEHQTLAGCDFLTGSFGECSGASIRENRCPQSVV